MRNRKAHVVVGLPGAKDLRRQGRKRIPYWQIGTQRWASRIITMFNWKDLLSYLQPALEAAGEKLPFTRRLTPKYNDDFDNITLTVLTSVGEFFIVGDTNLEKWVLSDTVVTRGVHTLRNGDPGYPDDYDVKERFQCRPEEIHRLARAFANLVAERRIDCAIEGRDEDKMAEDFGAEFSSCPRRD